MQTEKFQRLKEIEIDIKKLSTALNSIDILIEDLKDNSRISESLLYIRANGKVEGETVFLLNSVELSLELLNFIKKEYSKNIEKLNKEFEEA